MSKIDEKKYLVALVVEDHPGVTMKVAGLFARRGINLYSIAAAPIGEKYSRIFITARGNDADIEQIQKQMHKLIEVIKVQLINFEDAVVRELALIKVSVDSKDLHGKILSIIDIFKGKVLDIAIDHLTIEVVGVSKKIDSFIELIKEYGTIRELSRTGAIAIYRKEKLLN